MLQNANKISSCIVFVKLIVTYIFQEKNQRLIEIPLCYITIAELDPLVPVTVEGNKHLEMIPLISRQLTMTFIR